MTLQRSSDGITFVDYIRTPTLTPSSRNILFITPPPNLPTQWEGKPILTSLNLDSPKLKGKTILVKNFTETSFKLKLDRDSRVLTAGGVLALYSTVQSNSYKNLIAAELSDDAKLVARATLKISPKCLNLIVLYKSNPKTNRGEKIGYFSTIIPIPDKAVNKAP